MPLRAKYIIGALIGVGAAFVLWVAFLFWQDTRVDDDPSRCLPFPRRFPDQNSVEGLITGQDSGRRYVEGPIGAAFAVKSTQTAPDSGRAMFFVSFEVGRQVFTLMRVDETNSGVPTGSSGWHSMDQRSRSATHFPIPDGVGFLLTDGARESRLCVERASSTR